MAAVQGRPVAAPSGAATAGQRLAWLLRVNRLYGADDRWVAGSDFARALPRAGSSGVDPSQITRWERGSQAVGYSVIRRYEDRLGLPSHRLVAVADLVVRELRGGSGEPRLSRPLEGDPAALRREVFALLDKALGESLMTGLDWDRLTVLLWQLPHVLIYPASLWSGLADRLLEEMVVAEGVQWVRRGEALSRLLGHPEGELPVIAACCAMIADGRSQVVIEPMMVLEGSAHPDASARVLAQVLRPTSEYARTGAWWSAAEKAGHGHFTGVQERRLVREATAVLADGPGTCQPAAVEVMRLLSSRGSDRSVAPQRFQDSTAAVEPLVDRIYAATIGRMHRDVLRDDPMLRRLMAECLFHPQLSRRFIAANLIQASPYSHAAARAVTAELRRSPAMIRDGLAPNLISVAGRLGDHDVRPFLEELALSTGVPDAVGDAALRALAHGTGRSSDGFWTAVARTHEASERKMRSIVYALGVARRRRLLTRYQRDERGVVRTAAMWWLNLPSRVRDSTSRSNESPVD